MQLRLSGLVATGAAIAAPWFWLSPLLSKHDPIALFSQYLGMAALIAMAITQIISTRIRVVEPLFGGLDRGYVLHKWLGIGAMIAVLLHDTIDAEMDGLGRETVLTEIAETAGEISLYGLLILVVITVATFIPYHLWRWTHKAMGVFFALSAFHYLFILKPFANLDPLGLYVSAFCLLGLLAYGYQMLPSNMRPAAPYKVAQITQTGGTTALGLEPAGRPLRHRAGQFAFFRFQVPGLTEPHPFTISSGPNDAGSLQITVAPLGDMTHVLPNALSVGDALHAEGPYGRFQRKASDQPDIWIAAGIGITPFLAWADAMKPQDGPATLIYCVRSEDTAPHLAALRERAAALPNLDLQPHVSQQNGRLTVEDVIKAAPGALAQTQVYFCGPIPMRRALGKDLTERGLPQRNFHYEEFEIRTGIGLRSIAQRLRARL